ncbi:uncharacterized protein LOC144422023 [Styela clava]
MLNNCFASSSSNVSERTSSKYQMIENGCIIDSTLQYLPSPNEVTRRFFFKVFDFSSSNMTSVFIHCQALLCNSTDANSICKQQGCQRQKRSTSGISEMVNTRQRLNNGIEKLSINSVEEDEKAYGSIGPFVLGNAEDENGESTNPQMYVIIASCIAGVLFITLISFVAYISYIKIFSKTTSYLSNHASNSQNFSEI